MRGCKRTRGGEKREKVVVVDVQRSIPNDCKNCEKLRVFAPEVASVTNTLEKASTENNLPQKQRKYT